MCHKLLADSLYLISSAHLHFPPVIIQIHISFCTISLIHSSKLCLKASLAATIFVAYCPRSLMLSRRRISALETVPRPVVPAHILLRLIVGRQLRRWLEIWLASVGAKIVYMHILMCYFHNLIGYFNSHVDNEKRGKPNRIENYATLCNSSVIFHPVGSWKCLRFFDVNNISRNIIMIIT